MPKKIKYITIPLYISSVIYLILNIYLGSNYYSVWPDPSVDRVFLSFQILMIFGLALNVGMVIVPILVASALKKGKRWTWMVSWFLIAAYLPSPFFPLGISMLIGILDQEVKDYLKEDRLIWGERFMSGLLSK